VDSEVLFVKKQSLNRTETFVLVSPISMNSDSLEWCVADTAKLTTKTESIRQRRPRMLRRGIASVLTIAVESASYDILVRTCIRMKTFKQIAVLHDIHDLKKKKTTNVVLN